MGKVEVSGENFQKQLSITNKIHELLQTVSDETGHMSFHRYTLENKSFKELVSMGDKIIPYIFHLIAESGGSWTYFLLLEQITGQTPVKPGEHGHFMRSMISWMQWYLDSKYYPSDIYFGLVK